MALMNCAAPSRTVSERIQHVTHQSMSARTLRHRLQKTGMSAKCLLLRLSLTENHRRLRHQWCDERRTWTTE
ncbi:hypothetical protein TNCV_1120461 [Trichonephila clavipes]|uniref:Transposase Tc1-like domain-containing protein n=1 Tax=Trichonephila clavipes TaxID=2585209 RepID=A0A8X6VJ94_TRICX|nr:hypothetical protein TNCV_1120461 [Trichonephila clavipes]